jgi:hypothetical protein
VDLSREGDVQNLGERVVVEQGAYDFRDLFAWKDELRPQLIQRGVVFLDIDEQRNRLVLGVESGSMETFTAQLETFLRSSRVPPAAVIVEAAEPTAPLAALNSKLRPVPQGVQIQRGKILGGECTLGINGTRQGVRGFVTASHCTAFQSVVDGAVFFQASNGSSLDRVGVEKVDPPFFGGGACPFPRVCRFSDAAFVAYDKPSLSAGRLIANPQSCSFVAGPITLNLLTPFLPMTGFMLGTPPAGTIVTKIGRTTGCTFGFTKGTCVDVNVSGTNITMLCQQLVAGVSLKGDSGAPVFLHGADHATLTGILWGGDASGSTYAYSPFMSVFTELGGVFPDV